MRSGEHFDAIFDKCIRQTLSDILGKSGMQAILYHFEKGFGLRAEDIPNDPSNFVYALEQMFGLGARMIENAIMLEIESKGALSSKYSDFAEKVKRAQEKDPYAPTPSYFLKTSRKREQCAKEWKSFMLQEIQSSADAILDIARYAKEDYLAMWLDKSDPEIEVAKFRDFVGFER